MTVRSERSIVVSFSGDVNLADEFDASANSGSPGVSEFKLFATGFTTLLVPAGTVKALTIVPPTDNTNAITLKGTTADVGVGLSPSEPSSIAFSTTAPVVGLTVSTGATLIRLIWS